MRCVAETGTHHTCDAGGRRGAVSLPAVVEAFAAWIERDVVRAHGPDTIGFLQGQLSQDVESMAIDESRWSLLLQPTGKVDAWLRVTRLGDDDVILDTDAGWGDAVIARLQRFKLRTP